MAMGLFGIAIVPSIDFRIATATVSPGSTGSNRFATVPGSGSSASSMDDIRGPEGMDDEGGVRVITIGTVIDFGLGNRAGRVS